MTRKYTYRKGQLVPYESGSLIDNEVKAQREIAQSFEKLSKVPKRRRSNSIF